MSYAKEKGLVDGEARVFARNRLAVIVPRTNPARIGSLQDLARRGTKVVLAAEAVPVGKYSREALQNLAGAPGFPPRVRPEGARQRGVAGGEREGGGREGAAR